MNKLCNFCNERKAELRSVRYHICLQLACHGKLIKEMEKGNGK